jgi:hypothetical protein
VFFQSDRYVSLVSFVTGQPDEKLAGSLCCVIATFVELGENSVTFGAGAVLFLSVVVDRVELLNRENEKLAGSRWCLVVTLVELGEINVTFGGGTVFFLSDSITVQLDEIVA